MSSSVSGSEVLSELAVRSAAGKYCLPEEAKICRWSGARIHPDDARICDLTGLTVDFHYVGHIEPPRSQALSSLLDGTRRAADAHESWDSIAKHIKAVIGSGRCEIEAAVLSPDKRHLAVSCTVKYLLRTRYAGVVYDLAEQSLESHVILGKRTAQGWNVV